MHGRWAQHSTYMAEMGNVYKIVPEELEESTLLKTKTSYDEMN